MTGRPTVMMPLVKLEKKLMREGWKMVRMRPRVEAVDFAFRATAMERSPSSGVWGKSMVQDEVPGGGCVEERFSSTVFERLVSSTVSTALIVAPGKLPLGQNP